MKKRIVALCLVLALVAVMVMPMGVLAAGDTVVTADVGVAPTITSCNPASWDADGVAKDVVIAGTNFIQDSTGASAVTFSGTGITVNSFTVDSATQITANITIAHASTSTEGSRDVSVTVVGIEGTGSNVFAVIGFIDLNAPSAIGLGTMTIGVAKEASSGTPGTVLSNYSTWTVSAKDHNQGTDTGHMISGGTPLTNELQIGDTSSPGNGASAGFSYTADVTSLPFYASQTADGADLTGSYSITIDFTSTQS